MQKFAWEFFHSTELKNNILNDQCQALNVCACCWVRNKYSCYNLVPLTRRVMTRKKIRVIQTSEKRVEWLSHSEYRSIFQLRALQSFLFHFGAQHQCQSNLWSRAIQCFGWWSPSLFYVSQTKPTPPRCSTTTNWGSFPKAGVFTPSKCAEVLEQKKQQNRPQKDTVEHRAEEKEEKKAKKALHSALCSRKGRQEYFLTANASVSGRVVWFLCFCFTFLCFLVLWLHSATKKKSNLF